MWKLKIAEDGPWLRSVNNHVGRQHWEFDPDAGTPEERAEVERLRQEFKQNRLRVKQSSDLLMRMQLRKQENSIRCRAGNDIPVREEDAASDTIKEEAQAAAVTTTLRRAISYLCSIQAHDGHWPAEIAGPLFFLPPLCHTFAQFINLAIHLTLLEHL
ncbi:Lupeol synthase [Dionaea muscipula]